MSIENSKWSRVKSDYTVYWKCGLSDDDVIQDSDLNKEGICMLHYIFILFTDLCPHLQMDLHIHRSVHTFTDRCTESQICSHIYRLMCAFTYLSTHLHVDVHICRYVHAFTVLCSYLLIFTHLQV